MHNCTAHKKQSSKPCKYVLSWRCFKKLTVHRYGFLKPPVEHTNITIECDSAKFKMVVNTKCKCPHINNYSPTIIHAWHGNYDGQFYGNSYGAT